MFQAKMFDSINENWNWGHYIWDTCPYFYCDLVFFSYIIWFSSTKYNISMGIYDSNINFIYLCIQTEKKRYKNFKNQILCFRDTNISYDDLLYYKLVIDGGLPKNQEFLPLFVLLPALALNGTILYFYEMRK